MLEHTEPDYQTLQQAAEWFAVLAGETATDTDKKKWQQWLTSSQMHQLAWRRVEQVSQRFQQLHQQPVREVLTAAGNTRRQALKTLMLACISSAAVWSVSRMTPVQAWSAGLIADYHTNVGEVREIKLADGSQLWLNTNSAINVDYTPQLRRIDLLAGEVLISTAPDHSRPFVVDTQYGRLRALGTKFNVRDCADVCAIGVYAGAVEVTTKKSAKAIIHAGEHTTFSSEAIAQIGVADETQHAWSQGLLLADNMPLGDFIRQLSRYRHGYIACAPQAQHIRIVGAYPLDDTDHILSILAATLPIKINAPMPWWVTIEAA